MILCVITATLTAALCFASALYVRTRKRPPGPMGLPILGHLHLLGDKPHKSLFDLSKLHGPLMWLRFGSVPVIVASTPEAARLILQTNDQVFSGRPRPVVASSVTYGWKDITFSPPNSYWKLLRQICATNLLSTARLKAFKPIREMGARALVTSVMSEISEVRLQMGTAEMSTDEGTRKHINAGTGATGSYFVQEISARSGIPEAFASPILVSIRMKLLHANNNIISRMVFGRTLQRDICSRTALADSSLSFLQLVAEITRCMSTINWGDVFPSIAWMDLQGLRRCSNKLARKMDSVLQEVLDSRRHSKSSSNGMEPVHEEDLLDVLLSLSTKNDQINDDNIKAFILDMFVGGTDTVSYTTEWALAELLANPTAMKVVQEEVDKVVGRERVVGESDLAQLPYLRAVVNEAMRLHPVAPFLVPHASTENCKLMDFDVPVDAQVYVNVWAVGRDENTWEEPLVFKPERFLDGSVSMGAPSFKLLPFGAGRRGCPGWMLGLLNVQLQLASLLQAFHWWAPPLFDIDDKYVFVTMKAQPLAALAAPKLPPHLYLDAQAKAGPV